MSSTINSRDANTLFRTVRYTLGEFSSGSTQNTWTDPDKAGRKVALDSDQNGVVTQQEAQNWALAWNQSEGGANGKANEKYYYSKDDSDPIYKYLIKTGAIPKNETEEQKLADGSSMNGKTRWVTYRQIANAIPMLAYQSPKQEVAYLDQNYQDALKFMKANGAQYGGQANCLRALDFADNHRHFTEADHAAVPKEDRQGGKKDGSVIYDDGVLRKYELETTIERYPTSYEIYGKTKTDAKLIAQREFLLKFKATLPKDKE